MRALPTPTPEQRDVLESDARVRVVRASPGSGKTWLVAEVIRQELKTWSTTTGGIAAISFTRVGGEEIRKTVGHELGHPHFVGTIDAFLFRYVIRPHLRRVFSEFTDLRLVGGDAGAEHWRWYGVNKKTNVAKGLSLFGCVCTGEQDGKPVFAYKPHPTQPLRPVTGKDLEWLRDSKRRVWSERGLLTHSDAALWTLRVLEDRQFGPTICAEIARRFPLLIVDELQDTGHFLGKSIRVLLGTSTLRGVLVGDPDQAIYEFTGARPDLFDEFEEIKGSKRLPLSTSQRCPLPVARAALHVKDTGGGIGAAKDRDGRAALVAYDDMVVDVLKVVEGVRKSGTGMRIKVIARAGTTVEALAGRRSQPVPSLHCPPLTHIHRAVVAFRRERKTAALAAARAALELAIFQHEAVTDEELTAVRIAPSEWKELAVRCLLRVNAIMADASFFDWQTLAGEALDAEIDLFGLVPGLTFRAGNLRPQKRKGWDRPSLDFLPRSTSNVPAISGIPVQTVHAVKGETHDITVFVCPPATPSRCPSTVWWSNDAKHREEKRIAYVAMTRTQGDLILCVSRDSHERLVADRPEFVANFEYLSVDECATVQWGSPAAEEGEDSAGCM